MQKQKINKRILLKNIEIIDITSKGKSIAKSEGRIILVDNAVPGDFCDIEIYKKRRKYWQGKVISFIKYSPKRTKPKCEYSEEIGDQNDLKIKDWRKLQDHRFCENS